MKPEKETGIEDVFALLTGEPFYISPDVFAKLTEYQISVMVRAAVKRSEAITKGDGKGVPKSRGWNRDKPIPISREVYIAQGVRFFAKNAETLGKEYDEFAAEWERRRQERLNRG